MGEIGILNVGAGDTKLVFDKNNPQDCIRAARIVSDMLKRGYALLVEVERNGVKGFQRIKEFDEAHCEYIVADFDPLVAAEADANEGNEHEEESASTASRAKPKGRPRTKKIHASETRAVAVARTAGG